ncbi:hypothetical protein SUGI_0950310 [Cryptomeria japonica]|nr:hypothetical protein SUGI_0950310 [Cryptomeria japonica]
MVLEAMLKPSAFGLGSMLNPIGVVIIGLGILVKTLVLLFQRKVKGTLLKPLFILMLGSDLPSLCLVTLGTLYDEGFCVTIFLGSMAWFIMLYFLHLGVSLVIPIEVVLSSMEGEMDAVGGDLSPIEVELDAARYA